MTYAFRALAVAAAIALTPGCQTFPGPAPVAAGATPPGAAGQPAAEAMIMGRAVVDVLPLANAEVTVYDPILKQAPAAPGAGDGVRVEWRQAAVRTDAQGNFALPLSLAPGQAAEIYVSDGKQSVCAVVIGPDAAVRNAGKAPFSAARPLVVDMDTTATTGLMLNSLAALGRAAAAQRAKGPEAVLAMQAKALDAMAAGVGPAAAKLRALASTVGIATKIAQHMVQADPRVPAPARARFLLAAEGGNPVLSAVVSALEATGAATERELVGIVEENEEAVETAVTRTFEGDPGATGFLQDLGTALEAAAADDLAATRTAEEGQPPAPAGNEGPGAPGTDAGPGPSGSDGAEDDEDVDGSAPGRISVGVTPPASPGPWAPPGDPIGPAAYTLEETP